MKSQVSLVWLSAVHLLLIQLGPHNILPSTRLSFFLTHDVYIFRPHIKSIFQSIAAKVGSDPCCDWVRILFSFYWFSLFLSTTVERVFWSGIRSSGGSFLVSISPQFVQAIMNGEMNFAMIWMLSNRITYVTSHTKTYTNEYLFEPAKTIHLLLTSHSNSYCHPLTKNL